MKIWKENGTVFIDDTGVIPSSSLDFIIVGNGNFTVFDKNRTNESYSFNYADLIDGDDNPVGTESQVKTYLSTLVFNVATAESVTAVADDLATHEANTSNPHSVTKTQVGLGNVPNTDTTTTANITDSTNKRFVTDANLVTIGNQSGTNTGDQDLSGLQPIDSDLTAISGLTPSNDEIIQRKSGSWINRTLAQLWVDLKDLTVTLTNKTINLVSNTLSGTKTEFNTACSDGNFLFEDQSSNALDWSASTTVRANEIRVATASADGVLLGSFIRSNSARTTGSTFDVTEAGNWTMIVDFVSMTGTNRRATVTPRIGQRIYDTDIHRVLTWNGTIWTGNGIIQVVNKSGVDQSSNNFNVFVWDGATAFGVVRTTTIDDPEFAGLLVDGAVNNGTMTIVNTGRSKIVVAGTVSFGNNLSSSSTIGKAFNTGSAYVGTFGKAQFSGTDTTGDMVFNGQERF